MSSESRLSSNITSDFRYPALGEVERFIYQTSESLEERYKRDIHVWSEKGTTDRAYRGNWSEVSEEYSVISEGRESSFQVSIRDYYEDLNLPSVLEDRLADQDNVRELRITHVDGDESLFNIIADEIYNELDEDQLLYERDDSKRIHRFKRQVPDLD